MERERKGKREGSEGGRERKGREWEMEEGGEEEEGCQGEGGREREERGRRRGGSKATCDQCVLQFDSRSHDTGTSSLKYDWSTTGAFAVVQATHCIWCLSISLYLLLASWS